MDLEKIGGYAFLAGVLIAIVTAFVTFTWTTTLLVVLGLIVGFLNVTDKEVTSFLIASVALVVAGSANMATIPSFGTYLQAMLSNITMFVAPAAVIVALKAVYDVASEK